jgi:hypothetical protein
MKTYRITKFNPAYRNKDGVYEKDEWTSIADIGKTFDNIKFTAQEYIKFENRYIQALECILSGCKEDIIELHELEKYHYEINEFTEKKIYNEDLKEIYDKICDNYVFAFKEDVLNVIKLILRENIWGEIHFKNSNQRIEFGYDYYVYFMTKELSHYTINTIMKLGLYVEEI